MKKSIPQNASVVISGGLHTGDDVVEMVRRKRANFLLDSNIMLLSTMFWSNFTLIKY